MDLENELDYKSTAKYLDLEIKLDYKSAGKTLTRNIKPKEMFWGQAVV